MPRGRLRISGELLREMLDLPAGTRIVAASMDAALDRTTLVLEGPAIPESPVETCPILAARYVSIYEDAPRALLDILAIEPWNLPNA